MPSAQNKKEPRCGSFSLRGHPYWRMRIRLQGFPCNLHPNPQPSAKRDIAASKGRHGLCLRRRAKKEPRRGSFSLRGHPYWRIRIRLQGFPCNLHPNLQPSAKRDILQVGRGLAPAVCVKDAVHLTPQTGGTRWGARSGRTAPRGSPRQSRMPAGRSADNSRSSATRCA